MKPFAKIILSILFLSGIPLHAQATEKISVLIVTGQNNHDWFRSTPKIEAMLNATNRFDVSITTTPSQQAPEDAWNDWKPEFKDYEVVLSDYNGKMWPEKVKADFLSYVSGGGRVLLVHAANNAFTGWKEYEEMCGLMWRNSDYSDRLYLDKDLKLVRLPKNEGIGAGHGKGHSYQIATRDAENPIFKGMPEVWMHAHDELYHGQRGSGRNMHILASAFSSKESGGTGENELMVWWVPFGKGKCLVMLPGHLGEGQKYPSALDCVGFQTLLQRGTEWVATDKVTLPIPKNFPTADQVSLAPEQ